MLLNLLYLVALFLLSPWLLYKALTTGKYRRGLGCKLTGAVPRRWGKGPCAWFHGVSVGEIHLLRPVVAGFRVRFPGWKCVISTTTDTGYDEACKRFPDLPVIYWPLDFTWAVRRALRRVRPSLIILAEGELWPNFLRAAQRAGVPVAVVNGRMSPRSARRYGWLGPLARRLFGRLSLCLAQTEEYAAGYRALGVPAERLHITGNVKYDGALTDRHNPRTEALRQLFAVSADDLIWVAGSTQAPEEEILLEIFSRLHVRFPNLRLFLVPRQKERFEEVAGLLRRWGLSFVRRSELHGPALGARSASKEGLAHASGSQSAVVLVDSIGELGALWGLADVAYVGGSLDGRRGGQNMIEPAAYGAAVLFGPHTWNFKEAVARLLEQQAAVQVADAVALERETARLLADARERARLGEAARRFVLSQQGATQRTLDYLKPLAA
jgi:3-deoxy-D-manno-octulosonic-acid transferase